MKSEYNIGQHFSEGWALFTENAVPLIVGSLICFGILMVTAMVPFIGTLAQIAITGPLIGGLFILANNAAKGETIEIGQVFEGFQNFLPLFLVYLIVTIFVCIGFMVVMLPAGMIFGYSIFSSMEGGGDPSFAAAIPLVIAGIVGGLIAFVISCWYVYAYLFVVDRDEDFWQAMEASRALWFEAPVQASIFILLTTIVAGAGFIVFFVGAIVTVPFALAVITVAFRHITGAENDQPMTDAPPPPPPPAMPANDEKSGGDI